MSISRSDNVTLFIRNPRSTSSNSEAVFSKLRSMYAANVPSLCLWTALLSLVCTSALRKTKTQLASEWNGLSLIGSFEYSLKKWKDHWEITDREMNRLGTCLEKKLYLTLCPIRNRVLGFRFSVGIFVIRFAIQLVARWSVSILIVGKLRLKLNSYYKQVDKWVNTCVEKTLMLQE